MKDNTNTLKDAGLKVTHSRCKILELFQDSPDEHYTADKLKDLLADVIKPISFSLSGNFYLNIKTNLVPVYRMSF